MKEYYKKDVLENIVNESFSLTEILTKIGLAPKGSNFITLNKYINLYELDTSHFTGRLWSKGLKNLDKVSRIKLKDILNENTNFSANTLKKRLLAEGLKEYRCENPKCGITDWLGKPITLELHHINGDHYDNRLENLQLLCPNCHSQTDSYKRRRAIRNLVKEKPKKVYNTYTHICANPNCNKEFQTDSKRKKYCCRECYNQILKLNDEKSFLTKDLLLNNMTNSSSVKELAEKLNTSRTTIRKYLEKYNLLDTFKNNFATNTIHSKCILQYDLQGNLIKEWDCIADAQTTLHIYDISKCCNGKRKSAGGFKWKYKKDI